MLKAGFYLLFSTCSSTGSTVSLNGSGSSRFFLHVIYQLFNVFLPRVLQRTRINFVNVWDYSARLVSQSEK